ncbi:hypothetical protein JXB22_04040 [candidate division WOR-3 bacterium]|nr:hypothetical protein [candidate division WOR-3 bacterium]
MNYGDPILKPGILDRYPRLKNKILTRVQYMLLDAFGHISRMSDLDAVFARYARRFLT